MQYDLVWFRECWQPDYVIFHKIANTGEIVPKLTLGSFLTLSVLVLELMSPEIGIRKLEICGKCSKGMPDSQRYPWNSDLINNVRDIVFF